MKVALYPNHHALPFWAHPTQPTFIFDPDQSIDGWHCVEHNMQPIEKPASEHPMMSVLYGLAAINDDRILAHVSFMVDPARRIVYGEKRFWVQITTVPQLTTRGGMPVVVHQGVLQVKHIWGGDNGTYSPYDWLRSVDRSPAHQTPEFWSGFFLGALRDPLNKHFRR